MKLVNDNDDGNGVGDAGSGVAKHLAALGYYMQ